MCNRVGSTFTPQLAEAIPTRRITTDDLERDKVIAQRIALFSWVEEKHLDVPDGPECGGFLMFAQQGSSLRQVLMTQFIDCLTRNAEDKSLQSTPRQVDLHSQLL